jgi:biopolymer transport protein ExbD
LLRRPSSRRKTKAEGFALNLVPILDTMVTLIGFLLFTMSFLAVVSIESPFPQSSAETNKKKLQEKPLQLTVSLSEKDMEIWSPFEKIPSKKIPNTAEGQPDVLAMHQHLLTIKQKFPAETSVVIVPYAGSNYDQMISVMDGMRTIEKTDPPIFAKNAQTGTDEVVKALFPNVVFGNLLGDS